MALTAGAPTPVLVSALVRSGWGDMAGPEWHGMRAVLRALADVLPPKSGQGFTTANQLADASGYGERWTRAMLRELEMLDIIVWRRGGVVDGRPQPSFIRIAKAKLVDLIRTGRLALEEIRARRAARTANRLKGLRMRTVRPRRAHPAPHAELNASPSPLRGSSRTPGRQEPPVKTPPMISCDTRGCKAAAYITHSPGWLTQSGRDYCPDHAHRMSPAAPIAPRRHLPDDPPATLDQAAIDAMPIDYLDRLNRARARRGKQPLYQSQPLQIG